MQYVQPIFNAMQPVFSMLAPVIAVAGWAAGAETGMIFGAIEGIRAIDNEWLYQMPLLGSGELMENILGPGLRLYEGYESISGLLEEALTGVLTSLFGPQIGGIVGGIL